MDKQKRLPWCSSWRCLLLSGIALLAFAVLLRSFWQDWRQLEWGRFWTVFAAADRGYLFIAFFFAILSFWGRAIRWKLMCRALAKQPLSTWQIFKATSIGFAAVVLMGRAGELVRPYLIAVRTGLSLSSQLGVWLLERLYDLLTVLTLAGFALVSLWSAATNLSPVLQEWLKAVGYLIGTAGVASLAILIIAVFRLDVLRARVGELLGQFSGRTAIRIRNTLESFLDGLGTVRDPTIQAGVLFYTGLEWGLIAASNFFLFRAIQQTNQFGLADVLFVMGLVALGSSVQIPGVGGGVQVAAFLILHSFYSVGTEAALGIALFLWVLNFVSILPLGLWFAVREGLSLRKLKQASREVVPAS